MLYSTLISLEHVNLEQLRTKRPANKMKNVLGSALEHGNEQTSVNCSVERVSDMILTKDFDKSDF